MKRSVHGPASSPFVEEREDLGGVSVQKATGAYYTPDPVVRSLVNWAVRRASDRLLDPSCGDGRFLAVHPNSVGVEQDPSACQIVHERAPGSLIHQGDFFSWASVTHERFERAAGNPPFIRYQRFTGAMRDTAQRLCQQHGASFSSLSSSWAPFLVATASLLKRGGRMAFVVPAEIGHAPYATPVLDFMTRRFDRVQVIAVREKLFPELSEDCWLLYADGFGGATSEVQFTPLDRFEFCIRPPQEGLLLSVDEWKRWNGRLRPFLLSADARRLYAEASKSQRTKRLGEVARVGIGYVTGANDFFHLRPSVAERLGIPRRVLHPAVRSGRNLASGCVDSARVKSWLASDEPVLLLRLSGESDLPTPVRRYLESEQGRDARESYKCRNRDPWYAVPDVTIPDGFLSYMSGEGPKLVSNSAKCVGTNSVHVVHLTGGISMDRLMRLWSCPITALSCEIEGHPLGGGMLKVEPREAARIMLTDAENGSAKDRETVLEAVATMKRWRHYV